MRNLLYIVVGCLLAAVIPIEAALGDFSRYEVILARRPFGEAPAELDADIAASVQPVGPSFADRLQMCAITAVGDSLRVGFIDSSSKPPKSYYLFVGESEDGITVVSADYEAETALLRKGAEERQLAMGGGSTASGVSMAAVKSGAVSLNRTRRRRKSLTPEELIEKRRKAIEEKTPILSGQVYEAHIRKYNMELIRAGGQLGPPLPVTLTAEEDAKLVEEGVLPPVE